MCCGGKWQEDRGLGIGSEVRIRLDWGSLRGCLDVSRDLVSIGLGVYPNI